MRKLITISFVILFTIPVNGKEISYSPEDMNTFLSNSQNRAAYHPLAKIWLESVYNVGKPMAGFYAYMAFESLNVTSSAVVGLTGLKVGKDVLLEVAREYVENPEKVCDNLADALMKEGMGAYRRNYTRYRSWKEKKVISLEDFKAFIEDNHTLNYLVLGRDLFADIQLYKHHQGKYSLEKEFSASWEGAQVLLDRIDDVKNSTETPSTYGVIKNIVGIAQGNLANYPPYKYFRAEVKALEQETGTEFPLAKIKGVAEASVAEEKDNGFPVLKDHPDRPAATDSVYRAIDEVDVQKVWSYVYYKIGDIDGGMYPPWLLCALATEVSGRDRRANELFKEDPSLERKLREAYDKGEDRESEQAMEKLYNLTKSKDAIVMVNFLIDNSKLSTRNEALKFAAAGNNMEAINQLVLSGAEITEEVLEMVAKQRLPNRLTYLLKRAKKVDYEKLLYNTVAKNGHRYQTIQIILDSGVNVNTVDWKGHSLLYYAVGEGDIRLAKMLLKSGAIITPSALELAKSKGDPELIKLLEEHGVTPVVEPIKKEDIPDVNGFAREVFEAAKTGNYEFFRSRFLSLEDFPLLVKLSYPNVRKVIAVKGYGQFKKDTENHLTSVIDGQTKEQLRASKENLEKIGISIESGKFVRGKYDFEDARLYVFGDFYYPKSNKFIPLQLSIRCHWMGNSWKFFAGPTSFYNTPEGTIGFQNK